MYTISHDYYAILGVAKDATPEEIKGQYKRLMKEHHPDQYNGLKAKYEKGGDEALLKILGEKIKEAEEFCKLLNEAFAVLSDPLKRKQYDEQTVESKVEEPKISVSPKTISFGTLKDGEKKSSIFTIKNDGGPAASVNIDWEGTKPDWGDLIIEPDENNVFPIKVTVSVNTTGVPAGPKEDKILITVDGKVQFVEVFLSVRATAPAPSAISLTTTGPKLPRYTIPAGLGLVLIVGCLVLGVLAVANNIYQQRQEQIAQATQVSAQATQEAIRLAAGQATQQAITRGMQEARQLIEVEDVELLTAGEVMWNACGSYAPCDEITFIKYTLTNHWSRSVSISVDFSCFNPNEVGDGWWPRTLIIPWAELVPGEQKTVYCFLNGYVNKPKDYCTLRIWISDWNDSWYICPYGNKVMPYP